MSSACWVERNICKNLFVFGKNKNFWYFYITKLFAIYSYKRKKDYTQNFCAYLKSEMKKSVRACEQCLCKFFLALVKSVPNFMLFCRKNEFCCNFALFRIILMAFKLVNCYFYFKKRKLVINHIIVASTDVWQSYFAHTFL